MEIGQRIKKFRQEYGYAAIELAQKLDVTQPHMSRLENGSRLPSIDFLVNLCSVLGITLGEFFADESDELPPDLRQLLHAAKDLTPKQREQLTKFIGTLKENE